MLAIAFIKLLMLMLKSVKLINKQYQNIILASEKLGFYLYYVCYNVCKPVYNPNRVHIVYGCWQLQRGVDWMLRITFKPVRLDVAGACYCCCSMETPLGRFL